MSPLQLVLCIQGGIPGKGTDFSQRLCLTAVKDIIFCNQTGASRMCNDSRSWLSEDPVCDSMSDECLDMLLAQSNFLGQLSKSYFAAYGKSVC